jgi:hypothetical protein
MLPVCLSLSHLWPVFTCHTPDIEGTFYLAQDFRVICFVGSHIASVITAAIVVALYALGLPLFIYVMLHRSLDTSSVRHISFLLG